MSTIIENRILNMKFNNQQFESGVKDSLSSLSLFEKSLDKLSGESFSFGSLSNAIGNVQDKLSTFHLVAVNVLSNIANKAIETGTNLVKSLSVDNIAAGWEKFGEKTTSVGTLRAQGYSMEEVNDQLERLNWFTDETSYNFTDMVNNISKFTASGKGLEESVTAMEGIANWAALSGQNAATASRAMYQISQAMGAGVMRLEDYKSIQNASMDTDEFRQKAIDAALALGTLRKAGDDMYEAIDKDTGDVLATFSKAQFSKSLTEGQWFNSDVMMKVFNDYSKATSQIKDFQDEMGLDNASEAIQQMEDMGAEVDAFGLKAFKAAQEARTFADVIDSVKDAASTGFMTMFETLIGNYEQATKLYTDMANAAYDIFVTPINDINDFLKEVFSGEDGKRETLWEGIANAGNNLVAILELVKEAFANVFPPITVEQVKKMVDAFRDFTEKIMLTDGSVRDRLEKTLTGLFSILDIGWQVLKRGATYFGNFVKAAAPVIDVALSITAGIGDFFRILDNSIQKIGFFNTFIKEGWRVAEYAKIAFDNFKNSIHEAFGDDNAISKFVDELQPKFEAFVDNVHDFLADLPNSFSKVSGVFDKVFGVITNFTGKLPAVFSTAGTVFENFKMTVINVFNAIKSAVAPVIDAIKNTVSTIITAIKDGINNISFDQVMAVGFLGLVTGFRKNIANFLDNIAQPFKDAGGLLSGVKDVIKNVNELLGGVKDTLSTWQQSLKADILMKIAGAIAVLTLSLIMLSGVDPEALGSSLGVMTAMLIELFAAMWGFSKTMTNTGWMGKTATTLIALSVSIAIFAGALRKLSKIDPEGLMKGLLGVFFLLGEIMLFMNNTNFGTKTKEGSIFGYQRQTETSILKMAEGLILISVAVGILTKSVEKLAGMDFMSMMQGLVGMFLILGEIMLFANNTNLDGIGAGKGLGIIMLAAGILILEKAVESLGNLDLGVIMQGLLGMFVVLGEIMLFLNYTNTGKMIGIGTGMILLAAAMNMLLKPIQVIGAMDLTQAMQGLLGMFLMLGEVMLFLNTTNVADIIATGAGLILMAAGITILSDALYNMGVDWKETAIGLVALFGAFVILGAASTILAPVVPAMIGIGTAILLIGAGVAFAGAGTMFFAAALVELGAAGLVAVEGIKILLTAIPDVVNAFVLGLVQLISGIAEKAPEINNSIKEILISICDLIIEVTPKIVETSWLVLKAVLEMLNEHGPEILHLVIEILKGIGKTLYEDDTVVRNVADLLNNVLDKISMYIAYFILAARDLIQGLIDGIKQKYGAVVTIVSKCIKEAWEAIKKFWNDFKDVGKYLIQGLLSGFTGMNEDVEKTAKAAGTIAIKALKKVLKISSPSKVTEVIGKFFGIGFAQGIDETKGDVSDVSFDLGETAGSGILSGLRNKLTDKKIVGPIKEGVSDAMSGVFDGVSSSAIDFGKITKDLNLELDGLSTDDAMGEVEKLTKSMNTSSLAVDTSAITLMNYGESAAKSTDILNGFTESQTGMMATFDPNTIISQTSAINDMAKATERLGDVTARNTENTEEYGKVLTRITDISQGFYADKLYDTVSDYVKMANESPSMVEGLSLMDYVDLKQQALGVQGMRGLLETIQDDWNAGIKMQLFTDKDVPFLDFIKERTKGFGTKSGYYENIHIVPIDPNTYVDEDGFVSSDAVAQGVADGMTQAAQSGYGYSQINYSGQLNDILTELGNVEKRIINIYERLGNTQVVLDTGVIAGAVAPGVDMYIGAKQLLATRGV